MSYHMCAMKQNGVIKCWGYNNQGQLGVGDTNNRGDNANEMGVMLPPVKLGSGWIPAELVLGGYHTCVRSTSNLVKCWGYNLRGQLGIEMSLDYIDLSLLPTPDKLSAVNLGTGVYATSVVCGQYHTCVLLNTKQVKCFGENAAGQIGYEGVKQRGEKPNEMGDNLPVVNLGTNVLVQSIHTSAGCQHTCVILATSQLMKCWGQNGYGQLGYIDDTLDKGKASGTMGDNLATVSLGTESRVKMISLGFGFTIVLTATDVLKGWGVNLFGQLGIGSSTSPVYNTGASLVATAYDTGMVIKQMSAGLYHHCILYNDNITLKCVGFNSGGQLGQGDTSTRGNSPTKLITSVAAINLGTGTLAISYVRALDRATCVVFVDYTVKCFGSNTYGKLGYGHTNNLGDGPGEMGSNLKFVDLFVSSTPGPTNAPTTPGPTKKPTTPAPTKKPTTSMPTEVPTIKPSFAPTFAPSNGPNTLMPTTSPITLTPTKSPLTSIPTKVPTNTPSRNPTSNPTKEPTYKPTISPSKTPTKGPTQNPTKTPTLTPTRNPRTKSPTTPTTSTPTKNPTSPTTSLPTSTPTLNPTTIIPTNSPTSNPTTKNPTKNPTRRPTAYGFFGPNESLIPAGSIKAFDLYLLIDTTRTYETSDVYCKQYKLMSGGSPSSCMDLMIDYAIEIVKSISIATNGYYSNDLSKGLRVQASLIKCVGSQKDPGFDSLFTLTGNSTLIMNALNNARVTALSPNPSSCPLYGLYDIIQRIENTWNNIGDRSYKAMITFTDAVLNDATGTTGTALVNAIGTIRYRCTPSLVLVPFIIGGSSTNGLNQQTSLKILTGNIAASVFEAKNAPWVIIPKIGEQVTSLLTSSISGNSRCYDVSSFLTVDRYWCGYNHPSYCTPRTSCQWSTVTPKGCSKIPSQNGCNFTDQSTCISNSNCQWSGAACSKRPEQPDCNAYFTQTLCATKSNFCSWNGSTCISLLG